MKRIAFVAAAFLFGACHFHFDNPHLEGRGLTEEDLVAPPNKSEVRSGITYSVRVAQEFREKLDQGQAAIPEDVVFDELGINLKRKSDGKLLWKVTLWDDSPEKRSAITETAYWDDEASHYYYRYQGGDPSREVWFGPIPLKFKHPTIPGHEDH